MNAVYSLVLLFTSFSLSVLKINCQSDWDGRWFPYDPNETQDMFSSTKEVNSNSDDNDTGPGCSNATPNVTEWNGKWFPEGREGHNIPMGSISHCDDGKTNLEVDYDGNLVNYTCYENKSLFVPKSSVHPLHEIEVVPIFYRSKHICMNHQISYDTKFPTYGPHRPVWPKYGEYSFVPVQRWLHSLEHGAIVMLYHPCADKNQVKYLKNIVRKCLYKHIISANNNLTPERPIALLSFGHRLFMSKVDDGVVIKFIKMHAEKGPEQKASDGYYSFMLEKPAEIISGNNNQFCPFQIM